MWTILGGLLVASAVSGILPLVNAELLVVGAAVAVPGVGVPLVAVASAAGQMASKTLLFGLARWAPSRLPARAREVLDKGSRAVSARGGAVSSLVFTSATVGVPPFYGVSLAAGALGMPLLRFLVSGGTGRILRFGGIAWAARFIGEGALEVLADRLHVHALVGV